MSINIENLLFNLKKKGISTINLTSIIKGIEQLQAELKQLREGQEWVSVDKLKEAVEESISEMRYDNTFIEEIFPLKNISKLGKQFQVQIKIVANKDEFIDIPSPPQDKEG